MLSVIVDDEIRRVNTFSALKSVIAKVNIAMSPSVIHCFSIDDSSIVHDGVYLTENRWFQCFNVEKHWKLG